MSASPDADPQPLPPQPPDAEDCCSSGCVRCIYDIYEDALERYQVALAEWRSRHGDESAVARSTDSGISKP